MGLGIAIGIGLLKSNENTLANNPSKGTESQTSKNESSIKLTYEEVNTAIENIGKPQLAYQWEYTKILGSLYAVTGPKYFYSKDKEQFLIDKVNISKITDNNADTLINHISEKVSKISPTGAGYDIIRGYISAPYIKENRKDDIEILAFIPRLNIKCYDNTDTVSSISYCSDIEYAIGDINHVGSISYKSYPYEQFKEDTYNGEFILEGMREIYELEPRTLYEGYAPSFHRYIYIPDFMKECNYKTSEYKKEDIQEEIEETDIEYYSVQPDGSLKLECITKGTIVTLKFN